MPTYREIADDLAARIAAGWPPAADGLRRLPTTQEIADEYGVSEATAYRALVLLGDRKLIRGEPGRARYVVGDTGGDNSAAEGGSVTDVG